MQPKVVITDKHAAYPRALRRRTWRATHLRTGLHRARGETTKAIERSHGPIKDRLRAMRGVQSVATGQRLLEGIEAVQAIHRGHLGADGGAPLARHKASARARRARARGGGRRAPAAFGSAPLRCLPLVEAPTGGAPGGAGRGRRSG